MKTGVAAALFLAALLMPLSGAQAQIVGQPFPMLPSGANAVLPTARTNQGIYLFDPVRDHGAPTDGTSDATAAIAASLTDCVNAGGGAVTLGPYSFVVNSANLTVAQGCALQSTWWPGNERANPPSFTNTPAIRLSSSYTINLSGSLQNIAVFRYGMPTPTGARQAISDFPSWTGTAITQTGDAARVSNVYAVGFASCFSVGSHQRPYIQNFYFDCAANTGDTAVSFDNVHDVGQIVNVEGWPFFSENSAWAHTTYAVSGVANNGSGLIRVTIPANILLTGDTVQVAGVGGFVGANNRWTATVVDATHIDLQGSRSAPTTTGTWTSGFRAVTVASLNSLSAGQGVSGTNIAGGTTISYIDQQQSVIYLSAATTGAGSGTTLTFSNGAYTSGGSVILNADLRKGTAFSVTNSENLQAVNTFMYGYDTAYYLGNGASWTHFVNADFDNYNPAADPNTRGFVIDGTALGTSWIGGAGQSTATPLYVNSSSTGPQSAIGLTLNPTAGGLMFSMKAGSLTLGINSSQTAGAYVADTITQLNVSGTVAPGLSILYNTNTGKNAARMAIPTGVLVSGFNSSVVAGNFAGSNDGQALWTMSGTSDDNDAGGQWRQINSGVAQSKWFRIERNGAWQILNNAYGAVLLSLSDSGSLALPTLATSGTIAGSLCATVGGTFIYKSGANCF